MLKISHLPVADARDGNVFKVEGHAVGQWVEELRRVCDEALAAGTPVTSWYSISKGSRSLTPLDARSFASWRPAT